MTTVLIADDDPVQLAYLAELIGKLRPSWEITAYAATLSEIEHELVQKNPSLSILDVRFAEASSLEFIQALKGNYPVIFVSGDPLFAAEAFTCQAIDFVLKPIQIHRLEQALRRADLFLNQQPAMLPPRREATSLKIFKGNDLIWTALGNVRYFEAQRKYTRVVLGNDEGLLKMGISAVIEELNPDTFWRIHRGLVVNIAHMTRAKRDELGRMLVSVADRVETLLVAKPYESLFREGFS